jgi:hypothetical protein
MYAVYTGPNTKGLIKGEIYNVERSKGYTNVYWVKGNDKAWREVEEKYIVVMAILNPKPKHNNPDSKTYTQIELENILQNAITYGVREITGHTIGDKIASVLVDEFLNTLGTRDNTNSTTPNTNTNNQGYNRDVWESEEEYEEWIEKVLARMKDGNW